jgi:hypothetical protein
MKKLQVAVMLLVAVGHSLQRECQERGRLVTLQGTEYMDWGKCA